MAVDDYKVGYGRPPRDTRFQPGRSGNPRGRPKGSKNYKTMLGTLLDQKVKQGRKKIPRTKFFSQMLVDQALEGDWSALKEIASMMVAYDNLDEPMAHSKKDTVDFAAMVARLREPRSDVQASTDTRAAGELAKRGESRAGHDDNYFREMAAKFGNGPADGAKSNVVNDPVERRDLDRLEDMERRLDALLARKTTQKKNP
jgi:hypothetical protein